MHEEELAIELLVNDGIDTSSFLDCICDNKSQIKLKNNKYIQCEPKLLAYEVISYFKNSMKIFTSKKKKPIHNHHHTSQQSPTRIQRMTISSPSTMKLSLTRTHSAISPTRSRGFHDSSYPALKQDYIKINDNNTDNNNSIQMSPKEKTPNTSSNSYNSPNMSPYMSPTQQLTRTTSTLSSSSSNNNNNNDDNDDDDNDDAYPIKISVKDAAIIYCNLFKHGYFINIPSEILFIIKLLRCDELVRYNRMKGCSFSTGLDCIKFSILVLECIPDMIFCLGRRQVALLLSDNIVTYFSSKFTHYLSHRVASIHEQELSLGVEDADTLRNEFGAEDIVGTASWETFRPQVDSRNSFKTPIEIKLYSNRQDIRDVFFEILRDYQIHQNNHQNNMNIFCSKVTNLIRQQLMSGNFSWFCELFATELVRICWSPSTSKITNNSNHHQNNNQNNNNQNNNNQNNNQNNINNINNIDNEHNNNKNIPNQLKSIDPVKLRKLNRRMEGKRHIKNNQNNNQNKTNQNKNNNYYSKGKQQQQQQQQNELLLLDSVWINDIKDIFNKNELFFFYFLILSDSFRFNSHLIQVLIAKIVQFTTLDNNNNNNNDNDDDNDVSLTLQHNTITTFSARITKLKVIAKFLGFLIFSPNYESSSLYDNNFKYLNNNKNNNNNNNNNSNTLASSSSSTTTSHILLSPSSAFRVHVEDSIDMHNSNRSVLFDINEYIRRGLQYGETVLIIPWACEFLHMMKYDIISRSSVYYEESLSLLQEVYSSFFPLCSGKKNNTLNRQRLVNISCIINLFQKLQKPLLIHHNDIYNNKKCKYYRSPLKQKTPNKKRFELSEDDYDSITKNLFPSNDNNNDHNNDHNNDKQVSSILDDHLFLISDVYFHHVCPLIPLVTHTLGLSFSSASYKRITPTMTSNSSNSNSFGSSAFMKTKILKNNNDINQHNKDNKQKNNTGNQVQREIFKLYPILSTLLPMIIKTVVDNSYAHIQSIYTHSCQLVKPNLKNNFINMKKTTKKTQQNKLIILLIKCLLSLERTYDKEYSDILTIEEKTEWKRSTFDKIITKYYNNIINYCINIAYDYSKQHINLSMLSLLPPTLPMSIKELAIHIGEKKTAEKLKNRRELFRSTVKNGLKELLNVRMKHVLSTKYISLYSIINQNNNNNDNNNNQNNNDNQNNNQNNNNQNNNNQNNNNQNNNNFKYLNNINSEIINRIISHYNDEAKNINVSMLTWPAYIIDYNISLPTSIMISTTINQLINVLYSLCIDNNELMVERMLLDIWTEMVNDNNDDIILLKQIMCIIVYKYHNQNNQNNDDNSNELMFSRMLSLACI